MNPGKQGAFLAGGGQAIVAPEFLQEYRPDAVIVMNPVYEQEITKMLNDLGLKPEIFTV